MKERLQQANGERHAAGKWSSEVPSRICTVRGAARGKKRRKTGVAKSWGRREKSELDMGLCVTPLWFLLLIRLSQAELGRVWTGEQKGKNNSMAQAGQSHAFP